MKFAIRVCGLSLILTFGLTLSNPQALGSYYFYESQNGVENSEIHGVRLRRDATEESDSVTSTTEKSSSTTSSKILSKNNIPESPVSDVSSQDDDSSKKRGYIPPESEETMILKEEDVEKPSQNIAKVIDTALDKGLDTKNDTEHYKYYNSSFVPFGPSWVDLEKWNISNPGIVKTHEMLSKSYRRAATIPLNFTFPFYGHDVQNITIATGGFLYTGDYVHSWLAATQYIAPLMANFDTSQKQNATVKYADNGTALVVEWGNVYLQSRDGSGSDSQNMEGPFTFQATLHSTGDIIFAYKTIPVVIKDIQDEEHPVKVGLSDAYIIERTIFFVRRKTIYEYHRVSMKDDPGISSKISNETAIFLKALPRCNMKKNCEDCLKLTVSELDVTQKEDFREDINTDDLFSNDKKDTVLSSQDYNKLHVTQQPCKWCPSANLCSDGFDRNKQKWLKQNCDKANSNLQGNPNICSESIHNRGIYNNPDSNLDDFTNHIHDTHQEYDHNDQKPFTDSKSNVHHAGVATVTIVILLILTICGWFCYAYFFPHSCSGQFLIKHRPSRWHWRRGEARYTAASIHM